MQLFSALNAMLRWRLAMVTNVKVAASMSAMIAGATIATCGVMIAMIATMDGAHHVAFV